MIAWVRPHFVALNGEEWSNYWVFKTDTPVENVDLGIAKFFYFLQMAAISDPNRAVDSRYMRTSFKFAGDTLDDVFEPWHTVDHGEFVVGNPLWGLAIETPLCVGIDGRAGRVRSRHYASHLGANQVTNEVELTLAAISSFSLYFGLLVNNVAMPIKKLNTAVPLDAMVISNELLHLNSRRDAQPFGSPETDRP